MRAELLTIGGLQLHVVSTLDKGGTPLLIFNGIGANAALLEPFMTALPSATITFDIPGNGQSPPRLLPRRFAGWADLATQLLDHFDVPRAHVMGLSWGGALAQEFALRHAARTGRLVLAATSTGQLMIPANPLVLSLMATPWRYVSKTFFRNVAGMLYGGDFRHNPARVEQHARYMTAPSMLAYLGQLYSMSGWTSVFRLHRLQAPTLILAGADDPLIPPLNARYMAAAIPNAQLQMFDCGHMFLLTRLDAVVGRGTRVSVRRDGCGRLGSNRRDELPNAARPGNTTAALWRQRPARTAQRDPLRDQVPACLRGGA